MVSAGAVPLLDRDVHQPKKSHWKIVVECLGFTQSLQIATGRSAFRHPRREHVDGMNGDGATDQICGRRTLVEGCILKCPKETEASIKKSQRICGDSL